MKQKKFPESILFLNENPLPTLYTKGAVSGKELRLRSALEQVKAIHVVAPKGNWVGDKDNSEIGELEKKIMVHHIPAWPYYFRAIPLFFWGCYWSLRVKPDLLEAESPILSGPAAVLLGKIFRLPTVVEVRASYHELIKYKVRWIPYGFKKYVLNFVFRTTLKHATGVIANSHYYQNSLKKIGIKSVVINPGIQLHSIKEIKNNRTSSMITLGFIGRLEPEKGAHLLIEAFDVLSKDSSIAKKIKLFIAGEGSEKEKLMAIVQSNPRLHSQVAFMGFRSAGEFLPEIDILINPNTVKHPLEMVNVEAAFFGKPVVCFGEDRIPETVIDGETGLKVKYGDPRALSESIFLLCHDPQLYQHLSSSTRQLARRYVFSTQAKHLQRLYATLLTP